MRSSNRRGGGFVGGEATDSMSVNDMTAARKALVDVIADEVAATRKWLGKKSLDSRVMAALEKVPRHEFILRSSAVSGACHPSVARVPACREPAPLPVACLERSSLLSLCTSTSTRPGRVFETVDRGLRPKA